MELLVSTALLERGAPQQDYKLLLVQALALLESTHLQELQRALTAQLIPTALQLVFKHQHAQSPVQQTPFQLLGKQIVLIVNAKSIHLVALEQPQEAAVTLVAMLALLDPQLMTKLVKPHAVVQLILLLLLEVCVSVQWVIIKQVLAQQQLALYV